jgi:hypothetical protein
MDTAHVHFLFHISAVSYLGSEQDLAVSDTTHPSHSASFVDTQGDFLNVLFTLPA